MVGFIRRNFLVPVPRVESIKALNDDLAGQCRRRQAARLRGSRGRRSASASAAIKVGRVNGFCIDICALLLGVGLAVHLSWNEVRVRAASLAEEWRDAAYEKGETQSFYNDFFDVLDVRR